MGSQLVVRRLSSHAFAIVRAARLAACTWSVYICYPPLLEPPLLEVVLALPPLLVPLLLAALFPPLLRSLSADGTYLYLFAYLIVK